jgi:hypothetical protein
MLTGGGYTINGAVGSGAVSAGTLAGDPGLRSNFGFNAKTQKAGVYQGNVNIIIRKGGHVYQIKSNSITSIGSNIPNPAAPCSTTNVCKGTFSGKANSTDITNPNQPLSLGGNMSIQINMTDYGEPGSSDTVAVTVYDTSNGNALYYSNNWSGSQTIEQVLSGGNLVVH